eukprot:8258529-Alexandrium_andersonii.AAC.1
MCIRDSGAVLPPGTSATNCDNIAVNRRLRFAALLRQTTSPQAHGHRCMLDSCQQSTSPKTE